MGFLDFVTKVLGLASFKDLSSYLDKDPAPPQRDYVKVVLEDAVKDGAVCLDGSAPLYYWRPGVGSGQYKWYIHHQGGGWCSSLDECLARSTTFLGSSLYEENTFQENGTAYFSQDPTENPMMWNWNIVYLRYCDGGSFSGSNSTVTQHKGEKLYFRGRHVLSAMMQDLLGRGLVASTDVVISGCSAGGLATYMHMDQWVDKFKENIPPHSMPKVVGMPDSGFFLDYEGPPQYHSKMRWVYEQQNSSAGVLQSCYQHYVQAGEDWKCMFAQYTAPFIQLPYFPLQSLYDSWQADNVLGNRTSVEAMNAFGRQMKELLDAEVMSVPQNGIFLDSCFHHGIMNLWSTASAQGAVISQAFQEWYDQGSRGLPNKGYFQQEKPFPCDACCGPSGPPEKVHVSPPKPRHYRKVLLTDAAAQRGAVCLDGSPAVYYHRPGTGNGTNKWYVHHEGGGWCISMEDCLDRSKGRLGSSKHEEERSPERGAVDNYFSQDPATNPMLFNWNMVWLRYCDGSSFTGSRDEVVNYEGHSLFFRGKRILDAMQEDLFSRGLAEATDVVVSGCSAGGLATFIHADQWDQLLKSRCASPPKVVAMPDSGFFLDYDGKPHYKTQMRWVYENHNSSAGVSRACFEHYKEAGEDWKCIFAQHTAPFIEIPTFPLQSIFDSWQAVNDLGSDSAMMVNEYGRQMKDLMKTKLLALGPNGAFLDSCYHHCGNWGKMPARGVTQREAFQEFYEKGAERLQNKGLFEQGEKYPCQSCCAAEEPSAASTSERYGSHWLAPGASASLLQV